MTAAGQAATPLGDAVVSQLTSSPSGLSDGAAENVPLSVLSVNGTLNQPERSPTLTDSQCLEALRLMLLSRAFDEKAISLNRQGKFGVFSPVNGQEASVIGSAMALDPARDWIVPQYRELPALVRHGLPLSCIASYFMGDLERARIPDDVNCLPLQISLAAQLPHATGLGWGLRLQGSDAVVLVYLGDGASSEGDFHEACNLAGVLRAPVVFFVQNNGWAISTPTSRQTAAAGIVTRSTGYGISGALVDGNDLLAVHEATAEAVARARADLGPTLIESRTYRMGPHNTADDPSRYVSDADRGPWKERDPVARVIRFLHNRRVLTDEAEREMHAEAAASVEASVTAARAMANPSVEQIFDCVFAEMPPRLSEAAAQASALYGTVS
jgi:pyruvate dehydrogenase E1 component alpha subunit